jgi:hypothetical protein
MTVELTIAGLSCFLLASGHAAVGLRWVLPALRQMPLPGTPFGPPSLTLAMLRFTWHIVSVMAVAFGVLLLALGLAPDADPETLLLRVVGAFWLLATVMALWSGRRPRNLVRMPVPLVFLLVAVMCWIASA